MSTCADLLARIDAGDAVDGGTGTEIHRLRGDVSSRIPN
jgi:hypothetical protein